MKRYSDEGVKPLNISIPFSMHRDIKNIAHEHRTTLSEFLRNIMKREIEKRAQKQNSQQQTQET